MINRRATITAITGLGVAGLASGCLSAGSTNNSNSDGSAATGPFHQRVGLVRVQVRSLGAHPPGDVTIGVQCREEQRRRFPVADPVVLKDAFDAEAAVAGPSAPQIGHP